MEYTIPCELLNTADESPGSASGKIPRAAWEPPANQRQASYDITANLRWYRAIFGTGIGATGLYVGDLDGDGQCEIVAAAASGGFSSNTYWYVLEHQGTGYTQRWVQPPYSSSITCLRVADVNNDGTLDVCVAAGNKIYTYDGPSLALVSTTTVAPSSVYGLNVVDVDSDGRKEFVFCSSSVLYVYDAVTGTQEYAGTGYGGYDLAVADVDGDGVKEIVVGNGSSAGYVINGQTHAVEWTNPTGFGSYVRAADLDGDGKAEVAAGFSWYHITVFDIDLHSPKYSCRPHRA